MAQDAPGAAIVSRTVVHRRPGQPVVLEVITSSAAFADHCYQHREELCRLHEADALGITVADAEATYGGTTSDPLVITWRWEAPWAAGGLSPVP